MATTPAPCSMALVTPSLPVRVEQKLPTKPSTAVSALLVDDDPIVPDDLVDQLGNLGRHMFARPGLFEIEGIAAEGIGFFDEMHLKALLGKVEGSGHAGNPTADYQAFLGDRQPGSVSAIAEGNLGGSHPHQIFGLGGRLSGFLPWTQELWFLILAISTRYSLRPAV